MQKYVYSVRNELRYYRESLTFLKHTKLSQKLSHGPSIGPKLYCPSEFHIFVKQTLEAMAGIWLCYWEKKTFVINLRQRKKKTLAQINKLKQKLNKLN